MKQPRKSSAERKSKSRREAPATTPLSDTLPPPPRKFHGRIGTLYSDFPSGCAGHAGGADWRSERASHSAGRRRLRPHQHFRGPVNTPTLQRLADEGLRYNRFHTTALCSPSRAALLTGRNHHSVHTGCITELSTGFPGYDGEMPKDAGRSWPRRSSRTATTPRRSASGTTRPTTRPAPLAPSTAGRPASASNISGASWAARPTIGTRRWSKTLRRRKSRRAMRSGTSPRRWRKRR